MEAKAPLPENSTIAPDAIEFPTILKTPIDIFPTTVFETIRAGTVAFAFVIAAIETLSIEAPEEITNPSTRSAGPVPTFLNVTPGPESSEMKSAPTSALKFIKLLIFYSPTFIKC